MKHVLIPIAGFARAGKDSLADAIFDYMEDAEPEYSVIILKFADELKADLDKALRVNGLQADVWTEDTEKKKTLRPLLVAYGEYRRSLNQDVWVDKVIKEIAVWTDVTVPGSNSTGSVILIPDMRYANEYEKLQALAQAKGWAFVPIYIERQFNLPANEAEAESIAVMASKGYFTKENALQLSFADKSVEAIKQWAKKFAQSMSVYR